MIGVHCNISSLGLTPPPCLEPGHASPLSGGTTFGFEAQGCNPYSVETGQQRVEEDNALCCVHVMGVRGGPDGGLMIDLQCATPRDVFRRPLHNSPRDRWKMARQESECSGLACRSV